MTSAALTRSPSRRSRCNRAQSSSDAPAPDRTSGAERPSWRSFRLSASSKPAVHAGHDDELRARRRDSLAEGGDRHVRAEEEDPPAARAEHEPERDQADVVALAGRARKDRERAAAAAPLAGEGEQSLADEVRRKVLLADLERSSFPLRADLPQRREDELQQDGLERKPSECVVEDAVHCRFVVRLRGRDEAIARSLESRLCGVFQGDRTARRLCSREALVEGTLHALDPLGVVVGVKAKASLGADRLEQPVAALPGAQEVRGDADSAGKRTNPKSSDVYAHNSTIHRFDRKLTKPNCHGTVERRSFDKGLCMPSRTRFELSTERPWQPGRAPEGGAAPDVES